MKTKITLQTVFYFSLFTFSFSLSFGQSWDWGAAGYSVLGAGSGISPISMDANSNTYITGVYNTSITFGTQTLTAREFSAFLVKYDSLGNVIWARQPYYDGGDSWGSAVCTDNSGNIYICGFFMDGWLIFGSDTLKAGLGDEEDIFLAKYNTTGNILWAKQSKAFASNANDAYSVGTDKSGNVFITGYFEDSIFFGSFKLTSPSEKCPFLVKYDSSGNILWATKADMPSSGCYGAGYSAFSDNSGNIYMAGVYETAIFFGTTQLLSLNNDCPFLAKFSPAGDILWAVQNNTRIGGGVGLAAITDNENNVYTTGEFWDSLQFGSTVLNSPSGDAAFLTKYDSNGAVLWAEQSSVGWAGTGLAKDNPNHIYLTGTNTLSNSRISFGSVSLNVVPWAAANAFLIKFNSSGNAICGSTLENVGGNGASVGVTSDNSGKYVYTSGSFGGGDTVICGPDTLINAGYGQVFTGRWLNCAKDAGINNISSANSSVSVFPNPNNGNFTVAFNQAEPISACLPNRQASQPKIEVYNVVGQKVLNTTLKQVQGDNLIDLAGQPNGIYLYRVISENGDLIGEGKVIIEK